jgi:SAM-dependent methyltransferase
MGLAGLERRTASGWLLRRVAARRARVFVAHLPPPSRTGERLLDIGSGPVYVGAALRGQGWVVAALDVVDGSYTGGIRPRLYDGSTIPFPDDSFDEALLCTVLHLARDPLRLLAEARRVARRLTVVEDLYAGEAQRRWTMFVDSLTNLEFRGHPHGNRTDGQWRSLFGRLGLRLLDSSWFSYGLLGLGVYRLQRQPADGSPGAG